MTPDYETMMQFCGLKVDSEQIDGYCVCEIHCPVNLKCLEKLSKYAGYLGAELIENEYDAFCITHKRYYLKCQKTAYTRIINDWVKCIASHTQALIEQEVVNFWYNKIIRCQLSFKVDTEIFRRLIPNLKPPPGYYFDFKINEYYDSVVQIEIKVIAA